MTPGLPLARLDRNESPAALDDSVLNLLAGTLRQANRYPDGAGQQSLVDVLAARNGCTSANVMLGAGSVNLLEMIWRCVVRPGGHVGFATPGFEMYSRLTAQQGGVSVEVPLTLDFGTDLRLLAGYARSEPLALVAITNPHNPSGVRCPPAELAAFVAAVPRELVVVVDEAYGDFDELAHPRSSASLAIHAPNVIVTRTFSKAFGLAGLRIGYALANPDLIRRVSALSTPYAVTDLACAAAVDVLQREDAFAERMALTRAERARLTAELRGRGFGVPDSGANFVLVEGHLDLAPYLVARGIATSSSSIGVRITVGDKRGGDLLLEAVRDYCSSTGVRARR